jgi:enhancing lycopene biosynthesis protein 2
MKFGVLLSGCGFMDGAEIREAVLALLAIEKHGHSFQCYAPNKEQTDVVDHLAGKPTGEKRNVLVESARIARGEVKDLAGASPADFDALVLPGGFGVAKSLCSFAANGPDCEVDPSVEKLLNDVHAAGKPIGAICIAPALIAKVLGSKNPTVTIGSDKGTAEAIETMGGTHKESPASDAVVDKENRLVTTPAYMCDAKIPEIAAGIDKLVAEVAKLAAQPVA